MEMKSLTIGGKTYDSFAFSGVPMDATSKYTASGRSSIWEWAALAKSGSTTEYEVPQGLYYIFDNYVYLVTIIDWGSPSITNGHRTIKIEGFADDGFVYFDVFFTNNPGGAVFHYLSFDTEAGTLLDSVTSMKINRLLPGCKSSDNGKILSVVNGAWEMQAFPTSSIPGGGLKKMESVSGYIGIPMADLPEAGTVWMSISRGDNAQLYSGTITITEGGDLERNDLVNLTDASSGGATQLSQATIVNAGFAIYGMPADDYVGVYQVVG